MLLTTSSTASPTNLRSLVETGSHFHMANSNSLPVPIPTNYSYESFRMGKSRAPDPYVNCPYDCKVGAVSTKFRRCEGLTACEAPLLESNDIL